MNQAPYLHVDNITALHHLCLGLPLNVLLFAIRGFWAKWLSPESLSLNRKLNWAKLFSELFPLEHWWEATVTPVPHHISSYYTTTVSKQQYEKPRSVHAAGPEGSCYRIGCSWIANTFLPLKALICIIPWLFSWILGGKQFILELYTLFQIGLRVTNSFRHC